MIYTIDNKRLIEKKMKKNHAEKRLLKMLLTEEIFNFVDFCSGMGIVWSTYNLVTFG